MSTKYISVPFSILIGLFSSVSIAAEANSSYEIPPLGTLFSTPEERDDIDARRSTGGVVDKDKKRRTIKKIEEEINNLISFS